MNPSKIFKDQEQSPEQTLIFPYQNNLIFKSKASNQEYNIKEWDQIKIIKPCFLYVNGIPTYDGDEYYLETLSMFGQYGKIKRLSLN